MERRALPPGPGPTAAIGPSLARFWARPSAGTRSMLAVTVCLFALALAFAGRVGAADDDANPYDDPPPLQATHGIAGCPPPAVRVLSPEAARREAHQRAERGTSCWLAGQCPPGGDYAGDRALNARVAAAIASDARFANASIWVETLRKFVTLKGCLADARQGVALEAFVRTIDDVRVVWQEAQPRGPQPR